MNILIELMAFALNQNLYHLRQDRYGEKEKSLERKRDRTNG